MSKKIPISATVLEFDTDIQWVQCFWRIQSWYIKQESHVDPAEPMGAILQIQCISVEDELKMGEIRSKNSRLSEGFRGDRRPLIRGYFVSSSDL
jgi:hypothetical protein